jgi:hypothetical protein
MLRLRWALLNNPSCLMHRLHIVIIHPLVALGVPWNHDLFLMAGLFFLGSHGKKKSKEVGWGEILTETGNRNRNIRKQHLFPNVSETRSRNTKEKPIAAIMCTLRRKSSWSNLD